MGREGQREACVRAREHTSLMLRWWSSVGVTAADLAVRRLDTTMMWHHDVSPLSALPLAWARAENARRADVYIRPARYHSWPLVILDDLPIATSQAIGRKYDVLIVHTSPQGGCHVWLRCSKDLDENQRHRAQQWLIQRANADQGSSSGEHLGRLAGFKNWKRGGVWVNVLPARRRLRSWEPQLHDDPDAPRRRTSPRNYSGSHDASPSGREWGWICGLLESGCEPTEAYRRLLEHARPRRGRDTERYARRTVTRALAHISSRSAAARHSRRS